MEFLRSIPQPLAVVGVAGMYRTGKSYLLNRVILNKGNGFGVGPTVNPCTKGIWVWGKPLKGQTPEGDIVNIVVVDSEGIGALDESPDHDNRIFSLTILICSCFIFNSQGSIDENSLQNLHLVANITKNIHIKAKGNEEVDPEQYSQYFPSFLWVVRDFSLRLEDEDGDLITPREYLEKALEPQKGFSDAVESKNKIRKMISAFFRERDCFTMVRPLTDDSKLSNLANMEMDQLRPEFVDQVLTLRKRITTKAKVKTLNGKPLSGGMLVGLLQSYVTSINEGAVPNIDNAWSYICKNQCGNALNSSLKDYENMMNEALEANPLSEEDLISIHKNCREEVIKNYKRDSIGEYRENYLEELELKIADKLTLYQTHNKREFERVMSHHLQVVFQKIEKKLNNGEYKDYFEYDKDLRSVQNNFFEMELDGPNKEGLVAEYILKKIPDGVHHFISLLKRNSEISSSELEKARQKLEKEIGRTRDEGIKERKKLQDTISELEISKSEMSVHIQCITESLNTIKQEKQELESKLVGDMDREMKKARTTIVELNSQVEKYRESQVLNEREIIMMKSEFEKEKALISQKLSYYESSDRSLFEKEKNFQEEISRLKEESNQQIRTMTQKNRETIEKLDSDLKISNQRLNDAMDDLKEAQNEKADILNQLKEKEAKYKGKINELGIKIEELESSRSQSLLRNSSLTEIDSDKLVEIKKNLQKLTSQNSQFENEKQSIEEEFKNFKVKAEKEKALLQQNFEFMESQLRDMKSQYDEQKKIQEATLRAFEGNTSEKIDFHEQLESIKACHKKEIKQLETELSNSRKRLSEEVIQLTGQRDELELKLSELKNDSEAEISALIDQVSNLKEEREKWFGDSKTSEEAKFRLVKETEAKFKAKINELENEIEETKQKSSQEIYEIQQKSEDDFKRMKQFFEEERLRLETKILEDKDRFDKKMANLTEEYEQKILRDQNYHSEEIENLQEEIKEIEIQHLGNKQHYEQDLSMRQQQLDQLEKQFKETKDALRESQLNTQNTIEQIHRENTEERKNLLSKLEQSNQEVNQKEKELYTLKNTNESLKAELEKIKEKREEKITLLEEENRRLNEKIAEINALLQKTNEHLMENKIESGKSVALSQQQNDFYSKRIEELQKQLDEFNRRTEEKLKIQRDDFLKDIDKIIQEKREEKLAMEERFETKRRELKELEAIHQRKMTDNEREKSQLTEKLTNIELELGKLEKKYNNDLEHMNNQLASIQEELTNEKKGNGEELLRMRLRSERSELELQEVVQHFDKEKALWEGKFSFLESQNISLRAEAQETSQNFEIMLKKMSSMRNNELEEKSNTLSSQAELIESRYQSQLSEMVDAHKSTIHDYQERLSKYEQEIRKLQEKLQSEGSGRQSAAVKALEAKAAEQSAREKSLNEQINYLKNDRDQKIMELNQLIEKERESQKKRISEIEIRCKELESKRSAMMFDHEKERSKWNIEKDHMSTQRADYLEQIDKLEKKKDAFMRENERLKNEVRRSKKTGTIGGIGQYSSNMLSGLNSSKLGERSFNRDQ